MLLAHPHDDAVARIDLHRVAREPIGVERPGDVIGCHVAHVGNGVLYDAQRHVGTLGTPDGCALLGNAA